LFTNFDPFFYFFFKTSAFSADSLNSFQVFNRMELMRARLLYCLLLQGKSMRKIAWFALFTLVVSSGCTLIKNASHNVVLELSLCKEECLEKCRNRKLAETAWQAYNEAHPNQTTSPDYANGFQEGFADYLFAGGDDQTPILPPFHYWKKRYQSPLGYQAMEEWAAGFRQGIAVARASGLRQWITVPYFGPPTLGEPEEILGVPEKNVPPTLSNPRVLTP
jgi:hypothetical protein